MPLQRIAIVGCSIAGLLIARDLIAQGFDVSLFDRSAHTGERGAGLMLNPLLLKEIQGLHAHAYDYRVVLGQCGQELWRQPIKKTSVLWGDLYQTLKKRVPSAAIYANKDVISVKSDNNLATIQFVDGTIQQFDFIIGADGGESVVRHYIDPNFKRKYCGYIAVRGLLSIDLLPVESQAILGRLQKGEFLNYWGLNTHMTCYLLSSDPPLINWMWYVNKEDMHLKQLLTDKNHTPHHWSLPQGLMPDATRRALQNEAQRAQFSDDMLAIMHQTPRYFIQAISTGVSQRFVKGKVAIIGDAAHLAVPHIGGSVNLAYDDAITLSMLLSQTNNRDVQEKLDEWSYLRRDEAVGDLSIALRLGHALQFEHNNWGAWTQQQFDVWWKKLRGNRRLYFE